jgi:hypothetical protein
VRIALDASGDPGVDPKGSSPFYVSVAVICSTVEQADILTRAIDELSRRLRHRHEFRFSKSSTEVKSAFFSLISPLDWRAAVLVYDKAASGWSLGPRSPAQFELTAVVETVRLVTGCQNAVVLVDGHGDDRVVYAELRQSLGSQAIKTARYIDSQKSRLVQVADMVAGAIARQSADSLQTPIPPAIAQHIDRQITSKLF